MKNDVLLFREHTTDEADLDFNQKNSWGEKVEVH